MNKWSIGSAAASAVALMLLAFPLRAQLPTMSDVDRGNEARAAGPLPEWDVALVKLHSVDDQNMFWQTSADGLTLKNLPLEQMICSAWDLKPYQISGLSGWMKSSGYDLTAKVSAEDVAAYKKLNATQRREMLEKLLAERFHLKTHMETKTLPIYDLVADKGGAKLKPSTAIEPTSEEELKAHPDKYRKGSMSMGPGMFEGVGLPIRSLASQLSNALGKPVHDATGLTGLYDISLHFSRDDGAGSADAPSVFSAVQEQLGLKLVPGKGPVETLIVDAAEKPEAD